MFLAPYFSEYLRQRSALMTMLGGEIFYNKAPQNTTVMNIVVLPAEDYDHGNISHGALTHKQEDFTILLVGPDEAALQRPWLELVGSGKIFESCRSVTVTSVDLGGTMFIQCILPQSSGQSITGFVLDGQEIGMPCIVIPMKGSFALPVLTP